MRVCCEPVGFVRRREGAPGPEEDLLTRPAEIVVRGEYCRGLMGVREGMLLWVIWYAHLAPSGGEAPLLVHPRGERGRPLRGVFASRSPARPCPLGLSLVYVEGVRGCSLIVTGLDAVDGTPVLDLKEYSPGLDDPREAVRRHEEARLGGGQAPG